MKKESDVSIWQYQNLLQTKTGHPNNSHLKWLFFMTLK